MLQPYLRPPTLWRASNQCALRGGGCWTYATKDQSRVPVSAHIHPARAAKSEVRQPCTVKISNLEPSQVIDVGCVRRARRCGRMTRRGSAGTGCRAAARSPGRNREVAWSSARVLRVSSLLVVNLANQAAPGRSARAIGHERMTHALTESGEPPGRSLGHYPHGHASWDVAVINSRAIAVRTVMEKARRARTRCLRAADCRARSRLLW
jgi:hypothetical protein